MGWSGGTFTRSNGTFSGATVWAQDRDAGTLITASNHDTHDEDLADGIDACLTKDGTNSPSAHLQWVNNNHWGGTSGGSGTAHTVTLSPAPTTYYAGMEIKFIPGTENGSGGTTLNVNSLGAKAIKTAQGEDLQQFEMIASQVAHVIYDGTNFVLVNPTPTRINWTPTYSGSGSLTTSSESTRFAWYSRFGQIVYFSVSATMTTGGTASTYIQVTPPITPLAGYSTTNLGVGSARSRNSTSGLHKTAACVIEDSNGIKVTADSDSTDWSTGITASFYAQGWYYSVD
jgi:hypothetical protein